MTNVFAAEWWAWCAAFGGALWGVTLQTDFGTISLRTKVWRSLLAVVAAIFIGPGLIHSYFKDADPRVSTIIMFAISLGSLTVLPIVLRRVQLLAKTGRLWGLPEDKQ